MPTTTPITLSDDQRRAEEKILSWYLGPSKQPFKLFGLAGTGKTTLVSMIVERMRREGIASDILAGAYTGKAASVLRKKGVKNADTVHGTIYRLVGGEEYGERV